MLRSLLFVCAFAALALAEPLSLPSKFDCRDYWTWCDFKILDQHHCGSCWAFASTEAFSDRLCAFNDTTKKGLIMSMQPLLECSSDAGCDGGSPHVAWDWLQDNFDSDCYDRCTSGCLPYDSANGDVPKCHQRSSKPWGTCDNGNNYNTYHKAYGFAYLDNDEYKIRDAIYWHGPVQACFHLYNNFYSFFDDHPDGIYTEESGDRDGSHCVKLLGWGTSSGTDYWVIANSWGTSFGNDGFFKFKRGTNLCNLEDEVSQGWTYNQKYTSANPPNITNPRIKENPLRGGTWTEQDLSTATTDYSMYAKAALEKIDNGKFTLEKLISVETQVVKGLNYKMDMLVDNGMTVSATLHRDLKFELELRDYSIQRM